MVDAYREKEIHIRIYSRWLAITDRNFGFFFLEANMFTLSPTNPFSSYLVKIDINGRRSILIFPLIIHGATRGLNTALAEKMSKPHRLWWKNLCKKCLRRRRLHQHHKTPFRKCGRRLFWVYGCKNETIF